MKRSIATVSLSGTLVATAYPEDFHRHRPQLEALFGPVMMTLAPRAAIETALLAARGAGLAQLAETRVPLPDSCRRYRAAAYRLPSAILGLVLLLAATSMVVLWLGFATVRGLRDGSLLAPEPVANIAPASA